jgi:nonsense-mediated mRNA decay protein 3
MNINLQGENRAIVELSGELKNQKLKTREEVDIKFSDQLCDSCSKINSGYFEAKLQIRGPGDKLDEALNISRRIIEKSGGDKEFASDVERVKNGFDIFIGSNSLAKKMARKIASEFDTERKDSKTLHGEKDGQRIYRSTYLVRILD